jgi:hypothetical protein
MDGPKCGSMRWHALQNDCLPCSPPREEVHSVSVTIVGLLIACTMISLQAHDMQWLCFQRVMRLPTKRARVSVELDAVSTVQQVCLNKLDTTVAPQVVQVPEDVALLRGTVLGKPKAWQWPGNAKPRANASGSNPLRRHHTNKGEQSRDRWFALHLGWAFRTYSTAKWRDHYNPEMEVTIR